MNIKLYNIEGHNLIDIKAVINYIGSNYIDAVLCSRRTADVNKMADCQSACRYVINVLHRNISVFDRGNQCC